MNRALSPIFSYLLCGLLLALSISPAWALRRSEIPAGIHLPRCEASPADTVRPASPETGPDAGPGIGGYDYVIGYAYDIGLGVIPSASGGESVELAENQPVSSNLAPSPARFSADLTRWVFPCRYAYDASAVTIWPNRDPLGDAAFYSGYSKGMTEEDLFALWQESLGPTYCFVRNNGINNIDINGLDRWVVQEGLHVAIIVETWDKCCSKVIGYERISFSAQNWWTGAVYSPGNVEILNWSMPSNFLLHYRSSCLQDKALDKWGEAQKLNPHYYSVFYYNCYSFAAQALGIGFLNSY